MKNGKCIGLIILGIVLLIPLSALADDPDVE